MKVTVVLLVVVLLSASVAIAEGPKLRATAGRDDTRIRFESRDESTIIDVISPYGIDGATIKRESQQWPKLVQVRLHFKGLESFSAGRVGEMVEWSVPSTGNPVARVSLHEKTGEVMLGADSPYVTEVRIVGGEKKIPLQNGYFEVPLPAKLFEGNPAEIKLTWIDFFRQ